jgi:hypothetical protein
VICACLLGCTEGRPVSTSTVTNRPAVRVLTVTPIGIYGGGLPGDFHETTLPMLIEVLGVPDQVYEHPDVPCQDYVGAPSTTPERTRTARWGDLYVSFNADNVMGGYVYSPKKVRKVRPEVYYPGTEAYATGPVEVGTPMARVLLDPTTTVFSAPSPWGVHWVLRGNEGLGLHGFATSSDPETATVTALWAGMVMACFGLPAH